MIQTENLRKVFPAGRSDRNRAAVDELNLDVRAGEVFGFLGPNGAGKTTTVRMLTALIAPTGGKAWVNGFAVGTDDMRLRQSVGVLTESPGLYEQMSAELNLSLFARLYEVDSVARQVQKYLQLLGLWGRRSEPVSGFSKGMKQKLAIARALVHEPKTVFLDEPTAALDPEASRTVRDFIAELKIEGRTIFLCTHNLDEADRLCDRIAVFKTSLVRVDTPQNLRRSLYGRQVVVHVRELPPGIEEIVGALPFVRQVTTLDRKLIVSLDDPDSENPTLVRRLVEAGADIQFVGEIRHSLEDVYFELLNNEKDIEGSYAN